MTILGAGTIALSATQAASGSYPTATAYANLIVAQAVPTLTFATIAAHTYGDAPFTVTATSASNGPVTYSVTSGPATISGNTVTLTNFGTVALNASQAATANYTAATATASFTVAAEPPGLAFVTIPNQYYGVPPLTVSATSASSGAITYSVASGPATISGATLTLTGNGTVVLSATQAANSYYAAATVTTSFVVMKSFLQGGIAFSGQYPITSAHVYLYAAGTTGYGKASTSLLTSASNTASDGSGNYYVTTDSGGNFNMSGDYTCIPGTVGYLYLTGGSYGGVANSAIGLLAALGTCPSAGNFATTSSYAFMNEVTTIVSAYAISGFTTDPTHVSSSGTTLATLDIQNAFATTLSMVNLSTGTALTTTPLNSGTVPQAKINSLANVLAACINSSGPSSSSCSTLLSTALSAGTTGTAPANTAAAAINIAHNPGVNITALYALSILTPPFYPVLTAQPNDFTLSLLYVLGGYPEVIGVDTKGNVLVGGSISHDNATWGYVDKITNAGATIVSAYAINGAVESGVVDAYDNLWIQPAGLFVPSVSRLTFTGSTVSAWSPGTISISAPAFDGSGHTWIPAVNSTLVKLNSDGTAAAGSPFSISIQDIALDASGNVWGLNSTGLAEYSNAGTLVFSHVTGSLGTVNGLALDQSGNIWIPSTQQVGSNPATGYVYGFTSTGTALPGSPFTSSGMSAGSSVAIDGANNVWAGNGGSGVTEFTNTGSTAPDPAGFAGQCTPSAIAIDGSGNIWGVCYWTNSVVEFVGAATPVLSPAVSLAAPYNALTSKP